MIPETYISMAYLREQVILHARPKGYGGKGGKWAPVAADLVRRFGARSVLDYGCGEGQFAEMFGRLGVGATIEEYDPAIRGKDVLPAPADLVVCTDVIEHVEPEKLTHVLAHLRGLTRIAALVVIATRPSGKTLTDGRNAHLILENDAWWAAQLALAGFIVEPEDLSPSLKPSREFVAVLT